MPKEIDWATAKAEYIAGGIGGRKLCEKYNIPYHKFRKVAEKEKWTKLRAQAKQKENANIVNAVAKDNAKHTLKIYAVADKLLTKIENTLDALEVLDSQSIKHFTSALKDIKDIKGIKSDMDLREQEARIEKLRKDAMVEEEDKDIRVHMGEEADKYGD